ncbi:fimbrial protein, partial [Escherichia coli]|nr:fimbrial protein [Escherichia coli]
IITPADGEIVELRSDTPAELQIPANYKGNIKIEMQIEDE